jgi:prevent-host-death family protein
MYNLVPLSEAKAKLSELLDRVSKGEEFIITRHDELIAKLVPAKGHTFEEIKQAVEQLKESRKGVRISLDEASKWKNKGHK